MFLNQQNIFVYPCNVTVFAFDLTDPQAFLKIDG